MYRGISWFEYVKLIVKEGETEVSCRRASLQQPAVAAARWPASRARGLQVKAPSWPEIESPDFFKNGVFRLPFVSYIEI